MNTLTLQSHLDVENKLRQNPEFGAKAKGNDGVSPENKT